MARVIVNKAQMERVLQQMPSVQNDLDERAEKVLKRAQELAPKDTGDLARSLSIRKEFEGTKAVFRIVSSDPNIQAILKGTPGPYNNVPPWRPGTSLGGWAGRHGFTNNRSKYMLARRIAVHGTAPAGTHEGKQDWIRDALREAIR